MCSAAGRPVTTLMITNNVQEAILLSDRIVPLSKGPRATLGPAVSVPLARPRSSDALVHDSEAIHIQARIVEFLTGFSHSVHPLPDGRGSVQTSTEARALASGMLRKSQ